MQPIHFDTRWSGAHGIGRFASELAARLPGVVPLRIIGPKLSVLDPIASSVAAARLREGCYFSPGFNPPLRSPIPVAFTIHDLIHLQVPEESSAVRRLYYSSVVLPAARRAWRILTVSEHSRRQILEWAGVPPERVHVVGNGVSAHFQPPAERSRSARKPFFLHVGRRAGHKNIPRLLQAFALARLDPVHRLVFTGVPDAATVVAARHAGIEGLVAFAGMVDDQALAHLYATTTGLVFPSLSEGFGLPIVEAMASGTPVITSSTSSMPEVAGPDNALLIDPTDVAEMARALESVASDELLWDRLSARGVARAASFSWAAVAERVQSSIGGFTIAK